MSTHTHLDLPRCEPDHAAMDDVGLWSETHQPRPLMAHRALPLSDTWPTRRVHVEPFGGCGCSLGEPVCSCNPPAPAEACTELLADPDRAPFVFPLEPILTRHQWLGPTLLALVCFVWLCIDGYLENLP